MAKTFTNKKGRIITLLTPKEKGEKYAKELGTGARFTNDNAVKQNKDGSSVLLSEQGKAYRAGYLDARKDIGKAYQARLKWGK